MRSTDDGGMTGIDEPDLQFVARLQREPDAAVGTDRAGIVRAGIAFRRAPTDRVEPARRGETLESKAGDRAGLRNHQEVEQAVGAGEDRRIDDIARTARRHDPHRHQQSRKGDQRILAEWTHLRCRPHCYCDALAIAPARPTSSRLREP